MQQKFSQQKATTIPGKQLFQIALIAHALTFFCGDASYVGAGEGLCVCVDVLSISTVVRTFVNLAIVAHCTNIKEITVSKLPAESSPTFGQWPGK